eukprot:38105-Chlamydomonas_euryale.AAC.3
MLDATSSRGSGRIKGARCVQHFLHIRVYVGGTGSEPMKGMPVLSAARQSQNFKERTHEGYACVERSKTEGINQRAGRCRKGPATA